MTKSKTRTIYGIILAHNISTTKEGKKRYGIQIKEKKRETQWINGFGELPAFIEEGITIEATITDDKWKNITSIEKAPETHTDGVSPENEHFHSPPAMEPPASLKPSHTAETKLECARVIAIAMKGELTDKTDMGLFMDATKQLYEWVIE